MILIDAGHGALDPVSGVYQTAGKAFDHQTEGAFHDKKGMFYEGVFNRQCADELRECCRYNNIPTANVFHAFKDNPLHHRSYLANDFWIKANRKAVLVSLHGNASGNWANATEQRKTGKRPARGFSVWTSRGQTNSDIFAEQLIIEMAPYLKDFGMPLLTQTTDGDRDFEADFWMLQKTACPAILIEAGFFDNAEDAKIMDDENFKVALATAIVRAYKAVKLW